MQKLTPEKQESAVEIYDPVRDIQSKFDFYIKIVIGILVVAMMTMLMITVTLVIESFRFNSATYQEYSRKIGSQNVLLEANKNLMEENKKLQELIKENQMIIQENQNAIKALLDRTNSKEY